jgi:hypothetical protein
MIYPGSSLGPLFHLAIYPTSCLRIEIGYSILDVNSGSTEKSDNPKTSQTARD